MAELVRLRMIAMPNRATKHFGKRIMGCSFPQLNSATITPPLRETEKSQTLLYSIEGAVAVSRIRWSCEGGHDTAAMTDVQANSFRIAQLRTMLFSRSSGAEK